MKNITKRLLAAMLSALMVMLIFPVSGIGSSAEDTTDDPLGADGACEGCVYGTYNGIPACVISLGGTVLLHICEHNFPDTPFRNFVAQYGMGDFIRPLQLNVIGQIDVSGERCKSLKGIEFFPALTDLDCSNNQLTELDVSQNSELTSLNCNSNQLTELDVSQNSELTSLNCNSNQLTELDVSQNSELTSLNCNSNQLTELDVSQNSELTSLNCNSNQLTELDVSQNSELTSLNCNSNQLTGLNVSGNSSLTSLDCAYNQILKLELGNNDVFQFASLGFQERYVSAEASGGRWVCDLSQYLTADELKRISFDGYFVESYDPETGLLFFRKPDDNEPPPWIYYYYNTCGFIRDDYGDKQELHVGGNIRFNYVPCDHEEAEWQIQTLPTCAQPGVEVQYCTQCGEIINTREIPATGHQWSQRTVVKPATCTQLGQEQWVCSVCGMKETREIPALGHDSGEWVVIREASCTQTGLRELRCTRCGEVLQSEEIPMAEHTAGAWEIQKPATCTEPGLEVQYCTQCGQIINTREIPATGHQWGEWIVEKPATVDSDGLQYRVCQSCGEREEQVIPAYGYVPGDTDGDGAIDGKDLLLMEQAVNGWDVSLIAQNADLNGDGKVNGSDLLLMYQKINSEGA